MGTPDTIKRLVDCFHRNEEYYSRGSLNETQLRREYLDPFFTALGWDIENKAGYADAYKDVIHEYSLKTKDTTEAPDYCFRIGGVRKFFLEAKKPSINIKHDIHPAFQLRSYAWSAKLPLSILTDFQEFAVYDCRIPPHKNDKASNARIMFLSYKEYLDKWEEIECIFARESILKGSFDKYVDSNKKKKGTAEVDSMFLMQMEVWRNSLARNIALRNPNLSVRELNYSVQKTIDRIVFLRICEDRGIEDYGQLMSLQNGANVYGRLKQIYCRADERFNSGLFHFEKERDRIELPDNLTLDLTIDDKTLKDVVKELYYPESPYEFSVLPADILGQVYEQFLGKIIRLTPTHQAVIDDKPEVKKSGGVYYTPTYIVEYIVNNTVGKLLEKVTTPKEISLLRILDPACGSGSFLLGAYQFLLDWHLKYYHTELKKSDKILKQKHPPVYANEIGTYLLTTSEKKRILLNNIYGVDIDSQAVEVTKLSLMLKVLEGESTQTLNNELKFFRERALPDLSNNIKCGNSIIGPDFYNQLEMNFLDEEEKLRINVFEWITEFKEIIKSGGFDAVIGNPPYIRIQRISENESKYFFKTYKTLASKTDISQVFIEKAIELINQSGIAGFICTSQWLATDYGKLMRDKMSQGFIKEVVHFGSLPVFSKADTYPAIFIITKKLNPLLLVKLIKSKVLLNYNSIEAAPKINIDYKSLDSGNWALGGFELDKLLDNEKRKWNPLSYYGKSYIGALTGMDEAFVVNEDTISQESLERDILVPYAYRGNEVFAFRKYLPSSYIIYPYKEQSDGSIELFTEHQLSTYFPNAFKHLLMFKQKLRMRMDSRKYYADNINWYKYLRPGSFKYINPIKLIFKGIEKKSVVGILEEGSAFNGANTPAIIIEDYSEKLMYKLLALLNSKTISYYLVQKCPDKLGGYKRFNSTNISNIPIPIYFESIKYDSLVNLAFTKNELESKITFCKTPSDRKILERQSKIIEEQINQLVYQLYGLKEEEIKLVEDNFAEG